MQYHFEISGFADEIDSDIELQFQHLQKLGMKYFEVRGVNGKNISTLDDAELDVLKSAMERYGIRASSIGSPIGKIRITDDFAAHMALLRRVIYIARFLDCPYIRIFSFYPPEGEEIAPYRDEVLERMRQMVALAEEEGVILLHENEKDIYGDTIARCRDLFDSIESPAFRGVFDPANFVQCGQKTYPEAFEALREHIVYMHIKDAFFKDGSVVPAGDGDGAVKELISALKKQGYNGFLSLEPHLGRFEGLAELETGDEMLALDQSGPAKFTLAYDALMRIIEEA